MHFSGLFVRPVTTRIANLASSSSCGTMLSEPILPLSVEQWSVVALAGAVSISMSIPVVMDVLRTSAQTTSVLTSRDTTVGCRQPTRGAQARVAAIGTQAERRERSPPGCPRAFIPGEPAADAETFVASRLRRSRARSGGNIFITIAH